MTNIRVDGGILAGGLGTRMSGQDKGLQIYQGQMMAEKLAFLLRPDVENVLLSCNRNEAIYQTFSDRVCTDIVVGAKGPLAGLHSLLSSTEADYLLITPCDTPKLQPDFAKRMLNELFNQLNSHSQIARPMAVTTGKKNHPLHLLIHRSYKDALAESLDKGHYRVMSWLEDHEVLWIDFSDNPEQFSNINTLEDLSI